MRVAADTGGLLDPKGAGTGLTAELTWNFEADTDGNTESKLKNKKTVKIKMGGAETSVDHEGDGVDLTDGKVASGGASFEIEATIVKVKWSHSIDKNGFVSAKLEAEFDLGLMKWNFEFTFPSGAVTAKVDGPVVIKASWDPSSGQAG